MMTTLEKSEYGKLWRLRNPDKVKAYNKRRTPEQIRAATADYYARNADAVKEKLRAKYAAKTPVEKTVLVAKHLKWRKDNPDKVKASLAKRRALPGAIEKEREASRKHRAAHPGYSNAARQKSIRKKQLRLAGRPKPKRCEACFRTGRKLCWDHCHQTGKFRGWICKPCNTALGCAKDSPKALRHMADYLERSKQKSRRSKPAKQI
jgi:hypothetical protein